MYFSVFGSLKKKEKKKNKIGRGEKKEKKDLRIFVERKCSRSFFFFFFLRTLLINDARFVLDRARLRFEFEPSNRSYCSTIEPSSRGNFLFESIVLYCVAYNIFEAGKQLKLIVEKRLLLRTDIKQGA